MIFARAPGVLVFQGPKVYAAAGDSADDTFIAGGEFSYWLQDLRGFVESFRHAFIVGGEPSDQFGIDRAITRNDGAESRLPPAPSATHCVEARAAFICLDLARMQSGELDSNLSSRWLRQRIYAGSEISEMDSIISGRIAVLE